MMKKKKHIIFKEIVYFQQNLCMPPPERKKEVFLIIVWVWRRPTNDLMVIKVITILCENYCVYIWTEKNLHFVYFNPAAYLEPRQTSKMEI